MSTFTSGLSDRPNSHEGRNTGIDERMPALKRTADGTIDYDFYIRRGMRMRAEATHGLLSQIFNSPLKLLGRWRDARRRPNRFGNAHHI